MGPNQNIEINSKTLILDGENASYLTFELLSSSTPADEFTTVREPCTRSESGFWRPSSWVLRCFMGFQQWKSRTLRCLPENLLALGRQLGLIYELQSI